jgi:hypothetical protein
MGGDKVVNNGEGRIRQGGNTREGVFLGFGGTIFIGEMEKGNIGSFLEWIYIFALLVLLEELAGGLSQEAPVVGNFGLRGQETVRNPRAREQDRLFLAGWEVSLFWAEAWVEFQNNIN